MLRPLKTRWSEHVKRGYGWLRNQDLWMLVLGLIAAGGLWAFIELADEVNEGSTEAVDQWVVTSIRPADRPAWLDGVVRDVTALGGVTVLTLVSLAVGGFLVIWRRYRALVLLVIVLAGGLGLNSALKTFFNRPRPDLVEPLAHVSSASFPSGHSLLATVVYLTLGALLSRLVAERTLKIYVITVALVLAGLVGLSRIYLGVHYPTDVLAGWTLGLIWAILCWLAARAMQRRGTVEKPAASPQTKGGSADCDVLGGSAKAD